MPDSDSLCTVEMADMSGKNISARSDCHEAAESFNTRNLAARRKFNLQSTNTQLVSGVIRFEWLH